MRQANPYASPYPTDPTFALIGDGLGRALFGDPVARQAQQQAQAELEAQRALMEQRRAAAGYDVERTRGVTMQNDASSNLVKLLSEGFPPPQPVLDPSTGGSLADIVAGLDGGAALEEQGILPPEPVAPPSYDDQLRALAPALFGTMGQMQGDKIDPNAVVGGLAALLGSDEFARRGMIAQGKTPGEEFALTPERADAIAKQGYDADYRKSTDVATINNASDIPVAEIRARGGVDAARVRADGTVAAAGVRGAGSGTDRGTRNNNPGNIKDGPYARSQPGYTGNDGGGFAVFASPAAGAAAQERLLENNYLSKGHNTPRKIIARYAPAGENSAASMNNYAAYVAQRLGIGVDDPVPSYQISLLGKAMREFETGQRPGGTTATAKGAAGGPTATKPSKPIPKYAKTELDAMADAMANASMPASVRGNAAKEQRWRTLHRGWAGKYYQRTGDVNQVPELLRVQSRAMVAAHSGASSKPKAKPAGGGWGKAAVVKP